MSAMLMSSCRGSLSPASPLVLGSPTAQHSTASQLLSQSHAPERNLKGSCGTVLGLSMLLGFQKRQNLQGWGQWGRKTYL